MGTNARFCEGSPRQPFAGSRLVGAATRPGRLRAPLLLSLPRSAGHATDSAVPPRTTPTTTTHPRTPTCTGQPPRLGRVGGQLLALQLPQPRLHLRAANRKKNQSPCFGGTQLLQALPGQPGHVESAGGRWRGPLLTTSLLTPATMPSGLPRCMHHHLHHHLHHRRPPTNPPTHPPWRAPPAPPRPRRSRRPARPRARPARTSRPARARSCPCSSRPPGRSGRHGRSARTWASRAWSSAP